MLSSDKIKNWKMLHKKFYSSLFLLTRMFP